jgi:hypothetical protein
MTEINEQVESLKRRMNQEKNTKKQITTKRERKCVCECHQQTNLMRDTMQYKNEENSDSTEIVVVGVAGRE